MNLSLRDGDALRVESAGGLLLFIRAHGESWEVRVARPRNPWWRRWLLAWREARQARALAALDERILRDIGMDAASGHPCALRAHAYRQQELRRVRMLQEGLF